MAGRRSMGRGVRRLVGLAVLVVLPSGCIRDYLGLLKGPGFDENSRRLTSEIPEREHAGKPHNLSTKAQEIEANFGFR